MTGPGSAGAAAGAPPSAPPSPPPAWSHAPLGALPCDAAPPPARLGPEFRWLRNPPAPLPAPHSPWVWQLRCKLRRGPCRSPLSVRWRAGAWPPRWGSRRGHQGCRAARAAAAGAASHSGAGCGAGCCAPHGSCGEVAMARPEGEEGPLGIVGCKGGQDAACSTQRADPRRVNTPPGPAGLPAREAAAQAFPDTGGRGSLQRAQQAGGGDGRAVQAKEARCAW